MRSETIVAGSLGLAFVVYLSLGACRGGGREQQEASPSEDIASAEERLASAEEQAEEDTGTAQPEAAPTPVEAPSVSPSPTARPESPRPVEKPAEPPAPWEDVIPSRRAAPPPPPEPPVPEIVEVTVPSGTLLELELLTPLDSSVNRVGDELQARTISPVYVKGELVLSKGTYVEGRVTDVQSSGRMKGRARLAFTFDRLSTRSGLKAIRTSYVAREAESGAKDDAKVIGGGAGLGALVGGILGGKKGAAIGATIGGAGGTGVVLSTKGDEIKLPVGTQLNVRLDEPVVLQLN